MSAEPIKTPAFDPQLLTQLLADRKTPGQIEDLLKDLRKAFIEHALEGELTDLLGSGIPSIIPTDARAAILATAFPARLSKPTNQKSKSASRGIATPSSIPSFSPSIKSVGTGLMKQSWRFMRAG